MLVDDSQDIRTLLAHVLRRAAAVVETASNGREAVDKAMSGNFGIVLMDLQMPIMDGYTAFKELRKRNFEKPIFALTAHSMTEERIKCLELGFNEHLGKPLNRDLLLQKIAHYTSDQTQNHTT